MLGKTHGRGCHEQKIFLRVYGYPQRTDKTFFYRIESALYAIAARMVETNGIRSHSLVTGYDDERGEYLQLLVRRPKRQPTKDLILWLDYRKDKSIGNHPTKHNRHYLPVDEYVKDQRRLKV